MHGFRLVPKSAIVWIGAIAASLSFLLTGPYSNFGPVGLLDPWSPWILSGLAVLQIAPPETASVLLNLAIVSITGVSLYWCVRRAQYQRATVYIILEDVQSDYGR